MDIADKNAREAAVRDELKSYFKPEFINRLHDIVIFNPSHLRISQRWLNLLANIATKLSDRGIGIKLHKVRKPLSQKSGFDPVFARAPVKRAMYKRLKIGLPS